MLGKSNNRCKNQKMGSTPAFQKLRPQEEEEEEEAISVIIIIIILFFLKVSETYSEMFAEG